MAEDLGAKMGERFSGGNPQVLKDLVDAGFMGRKTKKGIFDYSDSSIKGERPINQKAADIIKKHSLEAPAAVGGDEDIQLRLTTR